MSPKILLALTVLLLVGGLVMIDQRDARAGEVISRRDTKCSNPFATGT